MKGGEHNGEEEKEKTQEEEEEISTLGKVREGYRRLLFPTPQERREKLEQQLEEETLKAEIAEQKDRQIKNKIKKPPLFLMDEGGCEQQVPSWLR